MLVSRPPQDPLTLSLSPADGGEGTRPEALAFFGDLEGVTEAETDLEGVVAIAAVDRKADIEPQEANG